MFEVASLIALVFTHRAPLSYMHMLAITDLHFNGFEPLHAISNGKFMDLCTSGGKFHGPGYLLDMGGHALVRRSLVSFLLWCL